MEIELVLVGNGTATVAFLGDLEIAPIPLAACVPKGDASVSPHESTLTVCLALWGLYQLASDETPVGYVHWRSELDVPTEGTHLASTTPRSTEDPSPAPEKGEAPLVPAFQGPQQPRARRNENVLQHIAEREERA
ncbi:hypothetical protein FSARC_13364 [Fusarium sarcochroum]|uniref:Uncharacterized protein n=1 Tax=Fusarium sarcochroum TaxID=1208366 RepID=A0A8H4WTN1_9HYPO|nr:hypothetical protein FSARC_13364 [Fusarium sarcochroum]